MSKRNKNFKMPETDRGQQYMLTKENVMSMIKDGSIKDQHFLIRAIADSMLKNALIGG